MDNESYQIVSVYHQHVDCAPHLDAWSRRNIHGLNVTYLQSCGLRSQCDLIIDFRMWLDSFHVKQVYANDPQKERILLQMKSINDIFLPSWQERITKPYHEVAVRFKQFNIPILNKKCDAYIHNAYNCDPLRDMTETQRLRRLHCHHCSLYDTYEFYLFCIFAAQTL